MPFRSIPKVDRILWWDSVQEALAAWPRPVVLEAIREALDAVRELLRRGAEFIPDEASIAPLILSALSRRTSPSLRRVINGTGVVVNTNLGRSPLPAAVCAEIIPIATGYSNLEYDLVAGERGSRYAHVESLLSEITGAEAAIVVNNNAAAVLLALASLCSGKEGIVSRGELVEIGGSFRIPDVMRQSGAILREVGTTNRTHLKDYREAVNEHTGLLMKVHTSNFAVVGFTKEVSAAELADLGRELCVPVMADLGSGSLIDLSPWGITGEPTVQEYVRAGVEVITFSGDKLLGGPQAGIIVGSKERILAMKKHPLLRALRIDKLTLAALEATLRLYRDERQVLAQVPTLRMLSMTEEELKHRAETIAERLLKQVPEGISIRLIEGTSRPGGGSLPLVELPTTLLDVAADALSTTELERRLRTGEPPVVGRIWRDRFVLDCRTILDDDIAPLAVALAKLVP